MQPQPESEPQHKKGKTVLKRVGATRQLSSQASLPLIPSEQSWKQTIGLPEEKRSKRETEAFIMNQMLTHYQHKASRKIPGGCTQPATGMPSESARIVKVDKMFFHQYDQCAIDIKSQAQVAFSAQVLCTIVQTGRSS